MKQGWQPAWGWQLSDTHRAIPAPGQTRPAGITSRTAGITSCTAGIASHRGSELLPAMQAAFRIPLDASFPGLHQPAFLRHPVESSLIHSVQAHVVPLAPRCDGASCHLHGAWWSIKNLSWFLSLIPLSQLVRWVGMPYSSFYRRSLTVNI